MTFDHNVIVAFLAGALFGAALVMAWALGAYRELQSSHDRWRDIAVARVARESADSAVSVKGEQAYVERLMTGATLQ